MKFKLNDDGSIRLVGDNLVLFLALSAVRLRDASRGTVISLRGKETFKIAFEQSIDNDGGEPAEIDIPELAIQAARTLSEMEIMKLETKHGAVGKTRYGLSESSPNVPTCKVCHSALYDDAAKTGYCSFHEPKCMHTRLQVHQQVNEHWVACIDCGAEGPRAASWPAATEAWHRQNGKSPTRLDGAGPAE